VIPARRFRRRAELPRVRRGGIIEGSTYPGGAAAAEPRNAPPLAPGEAGMPETRSRQTKNALQAVVAAGLMGVSAVIVLSVAGPQVSALWAWLAVAPAAVGYLLVRRPTWSLGLPLWCGLIAGAGAVLAAVSDGSAPSPWRWATAEATLTLTYAALLLALASAVVGSLERYRGGDGLRVVPLLLLAAAPWAVLGYLLLEGQEDVSFAWRVRTEPVPGGPFLVLLTFLVGLNGAAVGYGLRRPRIGFTVLLLLGTFLLLGVGFLLAGLGLGPDGLAGPGAAPGLAEQSARSGLGFLHWMTVQLAAVWFLWLGHWTVLSLAGATAKGAREGAPAGGADRGDGRAPGDADPGRVYAILAVVYTGLMAYGLLVPLEYDHRPFEQAVRAFAATPYLDLGVWNRADLVANLLLFIPVGFFAMGALTREGTLPGRWLMAGLVLAGAVGLSLALEFFQLYFPPRTVSWNDVLAECAGAAVGTGLWLAAGAALTRWFRRVVHSARPTDVARQLLAGYVVGFFLYQLFPFDVVLSARELGIQVEQGKLTLVPFARSVPVLVLAAKVLLYVPVGYWAVARRKGPRRSVLAAVVAGTVYVAVVEVLQVFIFSRYSSTTDVVLGAAGALVGGLTAMRLGPGATKPLPSGLAWRATGWLVRLGLSAALVAVLVRGKWSPLEVEWPEEGLLEALARRVHVPFYYQYWNSEFQAVGQMLRDTTLPAVLAMLLVSLFPAGMAGRRATAAVLAAAVGVVVELGQIVFPPHVPDVTTAVLAAGGAVAGVYLYRPFVEAFIDPGGADAAPIGVEEPT
jgi:VanZ family protein